MKSLLAGVVILFGAQSWAYPDLARHGYANCIACHVSPSGGGVLTDYGRSLSKELLSTWGRDGEERPAWVVNQPESFKVGGDYRSIETYLNDDTVKDAQYFTMQADLEGAVQVGKFDFVATAGILGGPADTPGIGQFLSRRHYITLHAKENVTVRAGRFLPKYGLGEPNHTIVTEGNLGWDEGAETYNVEAAYLGDQNDLFITMLGGRPDDLTVDSERGVAISANHFFLDRFKVGASAMHGEHLTTVRDMIGIHGILGFTKKFYMLSEIDHQWKRGQSGNFMSETKGIASYQQVTYELIRGMHLYLVHQLSYLDFSQISSRLDSYGTGLKLYPRPHFEFLAEIRRERNLAIIDKYYDIGWIMFHYYL